MSIEQIRDLARRALAGAGASEANAAIVAESIADAEAEGIHNVGLGYLPTYCTHARSGKVAGSAEPAWERTAAGAIVADARHGFCHAAFEAALPALADAARETGIAALAIRRSYSAGVLGWFVDRLAREGLVALGFANASSFMAAWGGRRPFFGTNPIALGVPRGDADPMVVDLATSATARVNVVHAAARGEPIQQGWALDEDGRATTDAAAAMRGTMAPLGGYKGAALALLVDVLAAGLTGARWSFEAAPLLEDHGGPPELGQLFVAIAPGRFGEAAFTERVETLAAAMLAEDGVRLPGDRRHAARRRAAREGIEVDADLHARLEAFARGEDPAG